MQHFFDSLHLRARGWPPFQRLAIISRILLAAAFIPTGLTKFLGNRFTVLPTDTPVGYFFEAMYQTGFYWNFIGFGQMLAGVLVLIPATRTLGALMFFPIIANITVVTWSIGFQGTTYITAMMLLASVFLLCWDWDRFRHILFEPTPRPAVASAVPLPIIEKAGYLVGALSGVLILTAMRGLIGSGMVKWLLATTGVAVLMVLTGWVQAVREVKRETP